MCSSDLDVNRVGRRRERDARCALVVQSRKDLRRRGALVGIRDDVNIRPSRADQQISVRQRGELSRSTYAGEGLDRKTSGDMKSRCGSRAGERENSAK